MEYSDGTRAMRMLNGIVDPDKTTFGIYNCEQLSRSVWDWYLESLSTEAQVQERVDHALAEAIKKRPRTEAELA